jgi:hypothetical protein
MDCVHEDYYFVAFVFSSVCVICKFPRTSSAAGEINYDLMYYLKGAAAGGICCSITHGALTPVDVVKVCTVFAM